MECPFCWAPIDEGAEKCPSCGRVIAIGQATTSPPPVTTDSGQPDQPSEQPPVADVAGPGDTPEPASTWQDAGIAATAPAAQRTRPVVPRVPVAIALIVAVLAGAAAMWISRGRQERALMRGADLRIDGQPVGASEGRATGGEGVRPGITAAPNTAPWIAPGTGGSAPPAPTPPTAPTSPAPSGGEAAAQACQSNLKQIALAFLMYEQDYGDTLPPAGRWSQVIEPYIRNSQVFACPGVPGSTQGYAFNSNLSGKKLQDVRSPAEIALVFDSSAGQANAADAGQSWPTPGRHDGRNNCAFADGHVKASASPPSFKP